MKTYKTRADAVKYASAHCAIFVVDDSGVNSYGYSHVIRVGHIRNSDGTLTRWHDDLRSESISLTQEQNQLGGLGCFTDMFCAFSVRESRARLIARYDRAEEIYT